MKGIQIQKQKKQSYIEKLIQNRYHHFGKFIINHFKLNKNILLLKYKTLAPVSQLKSLKITDDFKNLMIDLLDTNKINIVLQKNLSDSEIRIFELLLLLSGLKIHLNYQKVIKTTNDYVDRFNILRGSLIAGDYSEKLVNELIENIKILNEKNKISDDDANELIGILK